MEYIITHYFCLLLQKEYFRMYSLGMEMYLTRTLILQIKIRNKCGKLGPNPSDKNGPVHFLLGAMLPCSTPFSTSGQICDLPPLVMLKWLGFQSD